MSHAPLSQFTTAWDEAALPAPSPAVPRIVVWGAVAITVTCVLAAVCALYPEIIRGEIKQLPAPELAVLDAIASENVRVSGRESKFPLANTPHVTVAASVQWIWSEGEYRATEITLIGGTVDSAALDELAKLPSLAHIFVPYATPQQFQWFKRQIEERGMKCDVRTGSGSITSREMGYPSC